MKNCLFKNFDQLDTARLAQPMACIYSSHFIFYFINGSGAHLTCKELFLHLCFKTSLSLVEPNVFQLSHIKYNRLLV